MNHEALASKAADAVGVTPHSDMRLFVEQAVKWALNEAALSAAEPVAWVYAPDLANGSGGFGKEKGSVVMSRDGEWINVDTPLYAAPPAPSVAVKALEWDEFSTELKRHFQSNTILGQYQIAYLGEFECWQLYSPQKSSTWKENFSRHKSSDEAKAAAQADYEARIRSALSAQVQDVAGVEVIDALKEAEPYVEICHSLMTQKETRANVWRVLKQVRAAIAAAPAKQEG